MTSFLNEVFGGSTENGALSYRGTDVPLIDLYFKAVRDVSEEVLYPLMQRAVEMGLEDVIRLMFYVRDCRGIGRGDRAPFAKMIRYIEEHVGEGCDLIIQNIYAGNIEYYGYWKDFRMFAGSRLEGVVIAYYTGKLWEDVIMLREKGYDASISLAAKYAPTCGGSVDKRYGWVKKFVDALEILSNGEIRNERDYRQKVLTPLRKHIDIVERRMCAGEWGEIQYEKVPSIAMNRLKDIFERHDKDRWDAYCKEVKDGVRSVKGGQVMPHEIIHRLLEPHHKNDESNIILEEQWKQQIEKIDEKSRDALTRTLVVSDVSGSMEGVPMEVSIALGLLISELLPEPWKNHVITFSETPTFHVVKGNTLYEKAQSLLRADWGRSTNIQKVFDLILQKASNAHIPSNQMPQRIIILSDMQFNSADDNYTTNHQAIKDKYTTTGYNMPQIIYWNLRGNTDDVPVKYGENGVILLGGFSVSVLNVLLCGDIPDMWGVVRLILDNERYARVVTVV